MKNYRSKLSNLIPAVISAVCVFLLFRCFASKTPFTYLTNDDVYLNMIVSGELSGAPDPRAWYIGYPAGVLLATLYHFFPGHAWYGLFECTTIAVALTVLLYGLLKPQKNRLTQGLTILLFFPVGYGFLMLHVAELQFTTVTGIIGAGALFLFMTGEIKETFSETLITNLPLLVLMFWSMSIRDKGFLMLLPFFGMIGLAKLLDCLRDKNLLRNLLGLGGVMLAVIGLVFLIGKLAYHTPEWKEFETYTGASETLYDYLGFPEYDTHEELYREIGMSRASYEASYHHYSIVLEPLICKDTMVRLEQTARDEARFDAPSVMVRLKEMGRFFLDRHLSYTDRPLNLLVYMLYPMLLFAALIDRRHPAVRDICFTGIARMVIWFYLVYNGRLPSRVSQAVYFAELFVLLAIWAKYFAGGCSSRSPARVLALTMFLMLVLSVRFGFPKAGAAASESYSRECFAESERDIKTYFSEHPDNFYFLDMNSFGSFTRNALKVPEETPDNCLLMGSWIPHSPWYAKKLSDHGIADPAGEAIKPHSNIYFVFMDTEMTGYEYLDNFFGERFPDEPITLDIEDTVEVSNDIRFLILHAGANE